jgi:hypothetical protein
LQISEAVTYKFDNLKEMEQLRPYLGLVITNSRDWDGGVRNKKVVEVEEEEESAEEENVEEESVELE